jgi:hypothetical protein
MREYARNLYLTDLSFAKIAKAVADKFGVQAPNKSSIAYWTKDLKDEREKLYDKAKEKTAKKVINTLADENEITLKLAKKIEKNIEKVLSVRKKPQIVRSKSGALVKEGGTVLKEVKPFSPGQLNTLASALERVKTIKTDILKHKGGFTDISVILGDVESFSDEDYKAENREDITECVDNGEIELIDEKAKNKTIPVSVKAPEQ